MEWLTNLLNAIKTKITGGSGNVERSQGKNSVKKPIFNNAKNKPAKNEISMISDISDEQIQAQKNRAKYINTVKNPDYKVKPNESPDKIAQKFGITTAGLLAANRLNEQTAKICTELGACSLVAGSYIYKAENVEQAIKSLKKN